MTFLQKFFLNKFFYFSGKEACFERIVQRFGRKSTFVVLGKFSFLVCLYPSQNRGRFHKLFCALRPTFEKLFIGVEHALRHAPNFNRAISKICAMRPTFMKSSPERRCLPTSCSDTDIFVSTGYQY